MTHPAHAWFPPTCQWCGHTPHPYPCNGQLWQGDKKTGGYVPCPCAKGKP